MIEERWRKKCRKQRKGKKVTTNLRIVRDFPFNFNHSVGGEKCLSFDGFPLFLCSQFDKNEIASREFLRQL